MSKSISSSFRMLLTMTILTGLLYPLAMTGLVQVLFPAQANGSMLTVNGRVVGSSLIGQNFASAKYFQGRPSAAGQDGYDATSSSGSNLGPTNVTLKDNVTKRIDDLRSANGIDISLQIPPDMVLSSGSGLDPDISPAAAELQIKRITEARGLAVADVKRLVDSKIKGKQWGLFGQPRVNVLELNAALDELQA